MSTITKISQLVPKPHISATELDGETRVTIKSWEQGEVGPEGKKEIKGKLRFEEFDRPLVLNATKRDALIAAFGDSVEAIVGKSIILFPTDVVAFGETKPAIGFKIPKSSS